MFMVKDTRFIQHLKQIISGHSGVLRLCCLSLIICFILFYLIYFIFAADALISAGVL